MVKRTLTHSEGIRIFQIVAKLGIAAGLFLMFASGAYVSLKRGSPGCLCDLLLSPAAMLREFHLNLCLEFAVIELHISLNFL